MFMMQIRGKIRFNSNGNGYIRVLNSGFATVPTTSDAIFYSQVTFWVWYCKFCGKFNNIICQLAVPPVFQNRF